MDEIKHWAESLQSGDRCIACIRHKTDGSQNIHNATVIVINNDFKRKIIKGFYKEKKYKIPYNELNKIKMDESNYVNPTK